jgi:MATE family multidrug resistance protein
LTSTLLVSVPATAAVFAVTLGLESFGVNADVAEKARAFLVGQTPALLLIGPFFAAKTFLQAHGRTRPALVAAIVANVINVGVCLALVRVFGALGAGLANSVAQLVLTAIALKAARDLRPRLGAAGKVVSIAKALRIGMPVGLQLIAEAGVFTTAAVMAGRLGMEAVSAHQIALNLASFSYMGALGVSGATAVRVGLAIGAGKSPRRAGLLGIALGAAVMSVSAAAFACFPRLLVGAFTADLGVRALGETLLLIAAVFQLFDGVQAVAGGALRGAGDVRFAFLANVGAHWMIGLPIALTLAFVLDWGARGLWWGLTAGLVAASLVLAMRFAAISHGTIQRT